MSAKTQMNAIARVVLGLALCAAMVIRSAPASATPVGCDPNDPNSPCNGNCDVGDLAGSFDCDTEAISVV